MQAKLQVLTIAIAAATAAGRREFRVTLDAEFEICAGYYALQNKNGGLTTQWKIGLKDDSKTYQDLVNGLHLQSSTAFKIADRFYREQPFVSRGKTITVSIETFEATASELNIDVLFDLRTTMPQQQQKQQTQAQPDNNQPC